MCDRKGFAPFGKAQCPALDDYADGVDTMAFYSRFNLLFRKP